jgi:hypothetical protein
MRACEKIWEGENERTHHVERKEGIKKEGRRAGMKGIQVGRKEKE